MEYTSKLHIEGKYFLNPIRFPNSFLQVQHKSSTQACNLSTPELGVSLREKSQKGKAVKEKWYLLSQRRCCQGLQSR